MNIGTTIQSLAIKMPSKHYSNEVPPYSEILDVPKNWWRFWGIKGRYLIDKSVESAEELAFEACTKAISLGDATVGEIDLILCNSTCLGGWSNDTSKAFPRFANQLKNRLGCTKAVAIDVEQECITFLVSLQIASNFIQTGQYKRVLVCSSEYISGVLDFTDISSTTFGDGAAAALVGPSPSSEEGLMSSSYASDATFYELALLKWRYPINKAKEDRMNKDYWSYFTLDKNAPEEMQKFVPVGVPKVIDKALKKINLTPSDIDFFIFHQPSKILVNLWANALELDDDKFMLTLEHYGCMVSVSMPTTLYEAIRQNKVKSGDKIVIGGAATGWGFGAQVWKLGNIKIY